jgi:hypothetical protein
MLMATAPERTKLLLALGDRKARYSSRDLIKHMWGVDPGSVRRYENYLVRLNTLVRRTNEVLAEHDVVIENISDCGKRLGAVYKMVKRRGSPWDM